MTNQGPDGIRYSYFSFNDLADWCNQDMFYGDHARDLSYEEALLQVKVDGARQYDEWLEEAEIAANETDPNMREFDTEREDLEFLSLEVRVEAALRDFADWIYGQLEEMWDDINSDEQVDETIRANEYTFTAEGRRFG